MNEPPMSMGADTIRFVCQQCRKELQVPATQAGNQVACPSCNHVQLAPGAAPTAAVAFTISHIAAVFLPALLGYLWITSPAAVFGLAASMAGVSLLLALMIPRHPEKGREFQI